MVVVGSAVTMLAAAATSQAASVLVKTDDPTVFDRVQYLAGPGEVNTVTVDLAGGNYTITDATAPLVAGNGCTGGGPAGATVTCSALGTNRVTVNTGDMNDVVTMNADPPAGTFIYGGPGDDFLQGGPANDDMRGGPNADLMKGGPGDDDMDPGTVPPGASVDACDNLEPDTCPDQLDGESGFNTIHFRDYPTGVNIDLGFRGAFSEQAHDLAGNLLVTRMRRFPRVVGTPGPDEIYGSAKNDTLIGAGGPDVICGGFGSDTVDYSDSSVGVDVTLDSNLPPDEKWASADQQIVSFARSDCRQTDINGQFLFDLDRDCVANDGMPGENDCVGVDVENVVGSSHDDVLEGSSPGPFIAVAAFFEPRGMNVLDGRGGNDQLDGLGGADVLRGGDGTFDTVDYSWETEPVQVTLDGAANDGSTVDLNTDSGLGDSVGSDVENIIGGSGDDTLGGSPADNVISGGDGNDILQGEGGVDTLNGELGDDDLQGQEGDDQLHGDAGFDTLDGGIGGDLLDGGADEDTVDYSNSTTPVYAAPDGLANDGALSNDGLSRENDNIASTVEDLAGGSDNDTLVGNAGNGIIDGGPGNDTLDGGGGSDAILGGGGLDTASYAGRAGPVSVDLASPGNAGEAGEGDFVAADVESVTGGNGNDNIAGNDAVNILSGGPGDDALAGRGGPDQIFGGDGNDTATGDAGNDTIAGEGGDDNLQGGTESDDLIGGDGNDQLDGGPANDILNGGAGNDTAAYASRTKDVKVTLDGADNDGEANERDQVRLSTESTRTGAGNDSINIRDGIAGNAACGGGNDAVIADAEDTVAGDCEQVSISSIACSVKSGSLKMSRKGVVGVRVTCPRAGKGTLVLQTAGAYRATKKKKSRKKLRLGKKSFSAKAGKATTVKLKLSKKARRIVQRNKRLRARATLSLKPASMSKTFKRARTLTIKAPKKKGRK
jgi:Ca2+-binding RTX toxin-like protein